MCCASHVLHHFTSLSICNIRQRHPSYGVAEISCYANRIFLHLGVLPPLETYDDQVRFMEYEKNTFRIRRVLPVSFNYLM